MTKVKIYGAGSIGNHLAQAARRVGWEVAVVDPDEEALRRMKEEIYPERYGKWDEGIELFKLDEEPKGGFDVIFLGTPPHVRMEMAFKALDEKPKVLQLEKPVCSTDLSGVDKFVSELQKHDIQAVVGYDHVVSEVVKKTEKLLQDQDLGKPLTLDVEFRETWKGIFAAHPWLSGPEDTYLGFWQKGGGASGEHSHATNLWQHFARVLGLGRVYEVSAAMQMVKDDKVDYDQSCFLHLTTDNGFMGRVAQDVVTEPVKKQVRIQFERGFMEILIGGWKKGDLLRLGNSSGKMDEIKVEKSRPDDFYEEILHIKDILDGKTKIEESPVSFRKGLDTMRVIASAHESRQLKKTIEISI